MSVGPCDRQRLVLTFGAVVLVLAGCTSKPVGGPASTNTPSQSSAPGARTPETSDSGATSVPADGQGIHKITHIVVIMQENRSFDSYFGTFPGADGLPIANGQFVACVADPSSKTCIRPYHDPNDKNGGGPHGAVAAKADIGGGKMGGFVAQAEGGNKGCLNVTDPSCTNADKTDVMGYHDAREIPNYWTYAKDFVLQDHMFEPNASWSLPSHLFTVSEWSAKCSKKGDPMSCTSALDQPDLPPDFVNKLFGKTVKRPDYAWTDLTYLLHKAGVSWKYYVAEGTEPDCEDDAKTCVATST